MAQGFFISHRPGPVPSLQADTPRAPARATRPLMADIARQAGVSIATVSRALRGDSVVADETRARIEAIADALRYGVDTHARALRLRQNHAVAVVLPRGPHPGPALTDPFCMDLLGSVADALAAQGRHLLLLRPEVLQAADLAREVETGAVSGLVIVGQGQPQAQQAQLAALAARGVPFVVWGAPLDGQPYTTVGGDNLVGGRLAAGHLLDRGARRVAFVGDLRQAEMAQRHAGYLQAHRARGVAPLGVQPLPDAGEAPALVAQLLQAQPQADAVFAGSDLLALCVVQALRQQGRRVPEDVLVAGYDNTPLAAQLHPPLTSVCPSTAQAGPALLQALAAVQAGGRPQAVLLPTRLRVRASSASGLRAARSAQRAAGRGAWMVDG